MKLPGIPKNSPCVVTDASWGFSFPKKTPTPGSWAILEFHEKTKAAEKHPNHSKTSKVQTTKTHTPFRFPPSDGHTGVVQQRPPKDYQC